MQKTFQTVKQETHAMNSTFATLLKLLKTTIQYFSINRKTYLAPTSIWGFGGASSAPPVGSAEDFDNI